MTKKFGTNVYAPIVAGGDSEDDAIAGYGSELGQTIHHFQTEQDKDAFTGKFKTRLYKSWCAVKESSAWYEWTGTKEDGADGAWSEFDMGGASSGVTLKDAKQTLTMVDEIAIEEGLELTGNKDDPSKAAVRISPEMYFIDQPSAYAAGMVKDKRISASNNDQVVFFDMPMTEAGKGIEVNKDSYGIQDPTLDDPNVTGGTPTEILATIGLDGNAPEDGRIIFGVKVKRTGEAEEFITNPNGKVVVYEREVSQGDKLKPMFLAGLVQAKGIEYIRFHVSHTFQNSDLVIDHTQSFMCFQQLTGGWRSSVARNTFENKAGMTFTPIVEHLGANIIDIADELEKDVPLITGSAGDGWEDLDGIGLHAITTIKAGIVGGLFTVQDDGTQLADFVADIVADHNKTRMLRGRTVEFTVDIQDKSSGWNYAIYAWTGDIDDPSQLFNDRNQSGSGEINLSANFVKIASTFISEDVVSGIHSETVSGIVPKEASNIVCVLYPVQPQQPQVLEVKRWSMSTPPFTAYIETSVALASELHLHLSELWARFVQGAQGLASLRYAYNALEQPAPTGEQLRGSAPITIDSTVNQIAESQAHGGEGAYKFGFSGVVSISASINASNESAADSTMTLLFRKVAVLGVIGDEIPDSRVTFTVKAGDKNVEHALRAFTINVVTGDRIVPRIIESALDGGYLECDSDRQPLIETVFDIKELNP